MTPSQARQALADAGYPTPDADVRLLLDAIVGWQRAADPGLVLDAEQAARLDAAVARRVAGEPVQHITGVAYFRNEALAVGPGVFVPRPETEVMTGWVLDSCAARPDPAVVELCAGSGAISRAIAHEARPPIRQWAVELSDDAVGWLQRNLAGTGVEVVAGDMAGALPELDGTVDVVVANPPYVPLDAYEGLPADVRRFDPPLALFSGADGLDAMRVVVDVAARLLRPGGAVAAEHAEVQHEAVVELFARDGRFAAVVDHRDLAGRWRFVTAIRA